MRFGSSVSVLLGLKRGHGFETVSFLVLQSERRAEHLPSLVKEGETAHSLGQLGGPVSRICRELRAEGGVNTRLACSLSENTTSCQNGIVSQRTNANEAASKCRPHDAGSSPGPYRHTRPSDSADRTCPTAFRSPHLGPCRVVKPARRPSGRYPDHPAVRSPISARSRSATKEHCHKIFLMPQKSHNLAPMRRKAHGSEMHKVLLCVGV